MGKNSLAGRIDIITELYNSGLLCGCKATEIVKYDDGENPKEIREVLIHDSSCVGGKTFLDLLNFKE